MVNIIRSYVGADVFACDSALCSSACPLEGTKRQGLRHRMLSEVSLSMIVDNFDLSVL